MTHSTTNRKAKERTKKQLAHRVRNLARLRQKHMPSVQEITLNHVSLGDLRARYKPTHYPLSPAVIRKERTFVRYPSDQHTPLLLYGKDGGLLAARLRIKNTDLIAKLSDSIDRLPEKTKHYKFKGINRSEYKTRHYGVWAAYMPSPKLTAEHRADGDKADAFIQETQPLFREMSAVLGALAPAVFKDFQLYPLPDTAQRACQAWAACVINNGGNNPNQTHIHRDVKESQFGYSCVVSCGDYTGGDITLYELSCKLEMVPGDILLFPDSLIHHNNEKAEGTRKSVVTFTQENVNDYWAREYGMNLKRKAKKQLGRH
jgi:hypothetical protein